MSLGGEEILGKYVVRDKKKTGLSMIFIGLHEWYTTMLQRITSINFVGLVKNVIQFGDGCYCVNQLDA